MNHFLACVVEATRKTFKRGTLGFYLLFFSSVLIFFVANGVLAWMTSEMLFGDLLRNNIESPDGVTVFLAISTVFWFFANLVIWTWCGHLYEACTTRRQQPPDLSGPNIPV